MVTEPQVLLDALSSPIRREILWLVWDDELPAGDIAAAFAVTAPTISQHLAVLRDAGLVEMRVDGSFRRYRAVPDAFQGLEALLAHTGRWAARTGVPEADHVSVTVGRSVRVAVEVGHGPEAAFGCFIDPVRSSTWLGVPVSIVDRRFACTTRSGIRVRGTYVAVVAPSLLVMEWALDDDGVPIPGNTRTAYLHVTATSTGARVEVRQLVATKVEAESMKAAWVTVLERFHDGIDAALAP